MAHAWVPTWAVDGYSKDCEVTKACPWIRETTAKASQLKQGPEVACPYWPDHMRPRLGLAQAPLLAACLGLAPAVTTWCTGMRAQSSLLRGPRLARSSAIARATSVSALGDERLGVVAAAVARIEEASGEAWVRISDLRSELPSDLAGSGELEKILRHSLGSHRMKFDGSEWCVSLSVSLDVDTMTVDDAFRSAREVIWHVSRSRSSDWVPMHCVKHDLEAKHGTFDTARWGFASFKDFLEEGIGKGHIKRNGKHPAVSLVSTAGLDEAV